MGELRKLRGPQGRHMPTTGRRVMTRADLGPQTYGKCPNRRCGGFGRCVLGIAHPGAPYVYNRCPICLTTLTEIAGQG